MPVLSLRPSVPFVGLTAASFAIAELLRRLNGGQALEFVSGSRGAFEDIEISATDNRTNLAMSLRRREVGVG